MFECSVCSLVSFQFRCIIGLITFVWTYPFVLLPFGLIYALVYVSAIDFPKLYIELLDRWVRFRASKCELIPFDYGMENGPHTWNCATTYQSPINIIDENVRKLIIRELLCWNHYDELPITMSIENTGHTVILRASFSGNTPTISGADLLACYTFVEVRFRWSWYNTDGSEHALNYKKYPLEIQAMHRTGSNSSGATSSYDILMVAYFYELSANNPFFDPLIQNLHKIQKPGSKAVISTFPLSYLVYPFRTGFYSYGGSQTEPPCYQGTEWFLYPEALAIGEFQLREFRKLLGNDGYTPIMRNARPLQNVGCRVISLNQFSPFENCEVVLSPETEEDGEEETKGDD